MDRDANPYRPGAGTQPPELVGRDELIDEFGAEMRMVMKCRPVKSFMPVGLRGVGKTVLVNRFIEIAGYEGARTAYWEASEEGKFSHLLAARLRAVLLELRSGSVKSAVTKALRALRSFVVVHLPDGHAITLGVEPAVGIGDSGILAEDVTDLLVASGEAAAARDSAILLAVDEAQYLSRDELGSLIGAVHRTNQLDLPVMVVATGLPQLQGLAGEARSYAERLFSFPNVDVLTEADARLALESPASQLNVEFDVEGIDYIMEMSRGYPYFLQEWGRHSWNAAPNGSSRITFEDVKAAEIAVIDTLDRDFFRVRFDRLTPKERQYMRAMAELGFGPHRSTDIAEVLGVAAQSVGPRRSDLIKKGMIYAPLRGETAFTVPMFDDFLKRNFEPDW